MKKIDCNCLIGHWPFRKLREKGIDAIREKHRDTGISLGLVANMNSIFYNDPLEGEEELTLELKAADYLHVMTVNPMLPCFEEDIEIAMDKYNICAVRIYPGYHQYSLVNNANVERLCSMLRERKLPLFISVRMEDERLNYLLRPLTPEEFGLYDFLRCEPSCKILLLTIRITEILGHKELFLDKNIWYDTSGLNKSLGIELLCSEMGIDKLVYGSQYPLFSLRSTLYLVEGSKLEEGALGNILWRNAQKLLERSGIQ